MSVRKYLKKRIVKKMKGGGPLGIVPKGLQKLKDPITKDVEKWGAKNLGIGSTAYLKEHSGKQSGAPSSNYDPTKESFSYASGGGVKGRLEKEFSEDAKLSGGGGVKGRLEKEFSEDVKLAGGGKIHKPVSVTPQDRLKKSNYKKGGDVKFGKGVKAKKKFLDSIGHKPFKHFEDKAEKDYKEGQTGYKNLKKRQKSTVPGFDFGISAAVMLAAQAAAAKKASDDAARARKQQAAQQQSAGEQEAAKGLTTTAKGIMQSDTKLASGGDVKKYRKELKSEIKGMGPEGKAYLRDVMSHKKYKGKLKGKYKEDLDKELYGMHKKGKEYLKDLVKEKDHKKKSSPHVKKIKHSLGQIIESKILKKQLREKENIPKKDIVGKSKGGWIQGAVKKPGALRAVAKKDKLIKGDEKLSASDLNKLGAKAKKSGNSLLAKRVSLAKTFAKMRKK